VKAQSESYIT